MANKCRACKKEVCEGYLFNEKFLCEKCYYEAINKREIVEDIKQNKNIFYRKIKNMCLFSGAFILGFMVDKITSENAMLAGVLILCITLMLCGAFALMIDKSLRD